MGCRQSSISIRSCFCHYGHIPRGMKGLVCNTMATVFGKILYFFFKHRSKKSDRNKTQLYIIQQYKYCLFVTTVDSVRMWGVATNI